MEKALGIRVVRHITKKPAGDAVDLEKHFRLAQLRQVAVEASNRHALVSGVDMCALSASQLCKRLAAARNFMIRYENCDGRSKCLLA